MERRRVYGPGSACLDAGNPGLSRARVVPCLTSTPACQSWRTRGVRSKSEACSRGRRAVCVAPGSWGNPGDGGRKTRSQARKAGDMRCVVSGLPKEASATGAAHRGSLHEAHVGRAIVAKTIRRWFNSSLAKNAKSAPLVGAKASKTREVLRSFNRVRQSSQGCVGSCSKVRRGWPP